MEVGDSASAADRFLMPAADPSLMEVDQILMVAASMVDQKKWEEDRALNLPAVVEEEHEAVVHRHNC